MRTRSTLATAGLVTSGVGIAVLCASGYFGFRALQLEGEIEDLEPGAGDAWGTEYDQKLEDGDSAANKGQILAFAGGGLLLTGVVLYFVGGDTISEKKSTVGFRIDSDSASMGFSTSF